MNAEIIILACQLLATGLISIRWLQEIFFFWKNDWDFSLKYGASFSPGVEGETRNPVSNKTKVFLAYPFMIIVFVVVFFLPYLTT